MNALHKRKIKIDDVFCLLKPCRHAFTQDPVEKQCFYLGRKNMILYSWVFFRWSLVQLVPADPLPRHTRMRPGCYPCPAEPRAALLRVGVLPTLGRISRGRMGSGVRPP